MLCDSVICLRASFRACWVAGGWEEHTALLVVNKACLHGTGGLANPSLPGQLKGQLDESLCPALHKEGSTLSGHAELGLGASGT